jgi:hypothetical protein
MKPCVNEDDCDTPMWCRNKGECPKRKGGKAQSEQPNLVRLQPTRDNLVIMVDLFCAIIETQIMPSVNSPLHHTARWLVDDYCGHKPKRKRTRLKHRKPRAKSPA